MESETSKNSPDESATIPKETESPAPQTALSEPPLAEQITPVSEPVPEILPSASVIDNPQPTITNPAATAQEIAEPPIQNETPTSASPQPALIPVLQSQSSEPQRPSPSQIFPQKNLGEQDPRSFLQRALEKIQFRKKAKLEKIMALAVKKRSITNDDVQKLLRVSDATATRYLAELVRQGRLKRFGATKSIRFEPIQ